VIVTSVSVITPSAGDLGLLARSAESLRGQRALHSGRLTLEHVVCETTDLIGAARVVQSILGERAAVLSLLGATPAAALAEGLRRAQGDVMVWLPPGEVLSMAALEVVADVFETSGTSWLTGMIVTHNSRGQITGMTLPPAYRRRLLLGGAYGSSLLPPLCPGATFWLRSAGAGIDLDALSVAGEHAHDCLWCALATRSDLVVVEAFLGTAHPPCNCAARPRRKGPALRDLPLALLDKVLWSGSVSGLKKRFNAHGLLLYDRKRRTWS
jgi:hypothetical protein